MSLITDRTDLDFNLEQVLNLDDSGSLISNRGLDFGTISAILDSAQKVAEDVFLPSAGPVDCKEPAFVDGQAITHPAIRECLDAFAENGFLAASFSEEYGGINLPISVQTCINGMFSCANLSAHNYSMLTIAAANLIAEFGSEQQKSTILPNLLSGKWFGTMCLSESQAGSSLSDINTKAFPVDNGRYKIQGSKMWISGGDQDVSENIIHLVLAKTPNAPPGVKGISLFIVPKNKISDQATILGKNDVTLAGLNHKMGNRGTTNALLNFGENNDCEGWIIGKENHGLKYMFHMMNEARIGVGHGAVMQALGGYLYSLDYAKERPQGRLPSNKDPLSPQVKIIEHSDVKRMLYIQKCYVEGGLTLVLYCANLLDEIESASPEKDSLEKKELLDLLTPIAKSWPAEFCLEANKHAIQILGGYGYTNEYPVERFYRDNRLNPIHEGTHAIHGLDILGRKVRLNNGRAFESLCMSITSTIDHAKSQTRFADQANCLEELLAEARMVTNFLVNQNSLDDSLSCATMYLDAIGHLVVGWLWLKKAIIADSLISGRTEKFPASYLKGKIRTMRFFYKFELSKLDRKFQLLQEIDDTFYSAPIEEF